MGYKHHNEKYVYCITNLINNKKYIGQSVNPQKRFNNHYSKNNDKTHSIIHEAMRKYGKENFKLEILYYGEDYNNQEKYYIKLFNTISPNGYNITPGGENAITCYGENAGSAKLKNKEVKEIKKRLIQGESCVEIQKSYTKVSISTIKAINNGESWFEEKLLYPLNQIRKDSNEKVLLNIIEELQNTDKSTIIIGKENGFTTAYINMINLGKVKIIKEFYHGTFPIRKRRVDLINEKIIKQVHEYILNNPKESLNKIGKKFNISKDVILRINKGEVLSYKLDEYSYPLRKTLSKNKK